MFAQNKSTILDLRLSKETLFRVDIQFLLPEYFVNLPQVLDMLSMFRG